MGTREQKGSLHGNQESPAERVQSLSMVANGGESSIRENPYSKLCTEDRVWLLHGMPRWSLPPIPGKLHSGYRQAVRWEIVKIVGLASRVALDEGIGH